MSCKLNLTTPYHANLITGNVPGVYTGDSVTKSSSNSIDIAF